MTGDGEGVTKMADSKMAAPTTPKMADSLNVARCPSPSTSIESRETTTAAVTTDDRPLEGEWQKVLSRKKYAKEAYACFYPEERRTSVSEEEDPLTAKEGAAGPVTSTGTST